MSHSIYFTNNPIHPFIYHSKCRFQMKRMTTSIKAELTNQILGNSYKVATPLYINIKIFKALNKSWKTTYVIPSTKITIITKVLTFQRVKMAD